MEVKANEYLPCCVLVAPVEILRVGSGLEVSYQSGNHRDLGVEILRNLRYGPALVARFEGDETEPHVLVDEARHARDEDEILDVGSAVEDVFYALLQNADFTRGSLGVGYEYALQKSAVAHRKHYLR